MPTLEDKYLLNQDGTFLLNQDGSFILLNYSITARHVRPELIIVRSKT
jgi:hypothetical protein